MDTDFYITLRGESIVLSSLDPEEKAIVDELVDLEKDTSDWPTFRNYWISKVGDLYEKRGLPRRQITTMPAWKIAQDLGSRIMVRTGFARPPQPVSR